MRLTFFLFGVLLTSGLLPAQRVLIDGKSLSGWEVRGEAVWAVDKHNVLIGQRKPVASPPKEGTPEWRAWYNQQAWLYTRDEFENFDLHLEYWLPTGGNSGVSLRDPGKAQFGIAQPPDFTRTPSKVAYEIQLNNQYPDEHRSGSIYGFVKAPDGLQNNDDWNSLDISCGPEKITVKINGKLAAEHALDPSRPAKGPIGLQLHDQRSIAMFRNMTIKSR